MQYYEISQLEETFKDRLIQLQGPDCRLEMFKHCIEIRATLFCLRRRGAYYNFSVKL